MNGKKRLSLPVPAGKQGKIKNGKYSLDDAHFIKIYITKIQLYLETDQSRSFHHFWLQSYKEITDTSSEYKVCKTFTSYINRWKIKDFEKYADEKMKKAVFDEKGNALTMNIWNSIVSTVGKCASTIFITKMIIMEVRIIPMLSLEKAEVLMQLSLITIHWLMDFLLLKVFPKCNIRLLT